MPKKLNSERFIDAYNSIDHGLRVQYNVKRSMSFSQLIRKAVGLNAIVRKYEDLLVDYGRLRNAIIHQNGTDTIIAEPNDEAVEALEKIAKLVTSPPTVLNTVARKNIMTVDDSASIKKTIELISRSGYSNLPIYKEGVLIGVANGQRIIDSLGQEIYRKTDINNFIENNPISLLVETDEFDDDDYYAIASKDLTVDSALNMFYENRKLLIILITKSGNYLEKPLGLITVSDIMDLSHILDNF